MPLGSGTQRAAPTAAGSARTSAETAADSTTAEAGDKTSKNAGQGEGSKDAAVLSAAAAVTKKAFGGAAEEGEIKEADPSTTAVFFTSSSDKSGGVAPDATTTAMLPTAAPTTKPARTDSFSTTGLLLGLEKRGSSLTDLRLLTGRASSSSAEEKKKVETTGLLDAHSNSGGSDSSQPYSTTTSFAEDSEQRSAATQGSETGSSSGSVVSTEKNCSGEKKSKNFSLIQTAGQSCETEKPLKVCHTTEKVVVQRARPGKHRKSSSALAASAFQTGLSQQQQPLDSREYSANTGSSTDDDQSRSRHKARSGSGCSSSSRFFRADGRNDSRIDSSELSGSQIRSQSFPHRHLAGSLSVVEGSSNSSKSSSSSGRRRGGDHVKVEHCDHIADEEGTSADVHSEEESESRAVSSAAAASEGDFVASRTEADALGTFESRESLASEDGSLFSPSSGGSSRKASRLQRGELHSEKEESDVQEMIEIEHDGPRSNRRSSSERAIQTSGEEEDAIESNTATAVSAEKVTEAPEPSSFWTLFRWRAANDAATVENSSDGAALARGASKDERDKREISEKRDAEECVPTASAEQQSGLSVRFSGVQEDESIEKKKKSRMPVKANSVVDMGFVDLVESLLLNHDSEGAKYRSIGDGYASSFATSEMPSERESDLESLSSSVSGSSSRFNYAQRRRRRRGGHAEHEDAKAGEQDYIQEEIEEVEMFADEVHATVSAKLEQEAYHVEAALRRKAVLLSHELGLQDDKQMLQHEAQLAGLGLTVLDDAKDAPTKKIDTGILLGLTLSSYEESLSRCEEAALITNPLIPANDENKPSFEEIRQRRVRWSEAVSGRRSALQQIQAELIRLASTTSEETSDDNLSERGTSRTSRIASPPPSSGIIPSSSGAIAKTFVPIASPSSTSPTAASRG